MFDINEIMKRAQKASEQAREAINKTFEDSGAVADHLDPLVSGDSASGECAYGESACTEAVLEEEAHTVSSKAEEQIDANNRRQVEILGQIFGADSMAQMAVNEELLQKMVNDKVAEAMMSQGENLMEQLFGEDMGVLAAALETLESEDGDDEEAEELFGLEIEENLYRILEEAMERLEILPEPEPIPYQKNDGRWERFGILLSGIVSKLNGHELDGMDVEEHVPVMEQQVVSLVRRSWGIDGRGDLLDMIRYLSQEGYMLRYRIYSEAASLEELLEEDMDEEDRESVCRTWRFAQMYKERYAPGFLAGWDIGRAAMLVRWGSYLGWITESEAIGILWDLSQKAMEELESWREFAQSYLFGGLMWKFLCGDSSAANYLGYVADAAADLLAGRPDQDGGQWRGCPWPAKRKIGFTK